jgi:large subunit ribosomal protein L2
MKDNINVKVYRDEPIKDLTYALRSTSGRNNFGRITIRARGGAHKRRFRVVDFFRNMFNVIGKVVRVEYDPNRTAYLALISYENGFISYIVAPDLMKENLLLSSGEDAGLNIGDAKRLEQIGIGYVVHNVEMYIGHGGLISRSAGTGLKLLRKRAGYVYSKMPSGEVRLLPDRVQATVGRVSNVNSKFEILHKAGENRWRGLRPNVRGVAKNPVDHPHGGGQGKTKGGRCSVSPWGRLTKGKITRSSKKKNVLIVKDRRGIKK